MPYQISQDQLRQLGDALAEYYEEAWQDGVKGLFDNMARSGMGLATAYLDQAKDTVANIRKKSNDKFGITFKPALKQQISLYLGNKNDVAAVLVQVAETALKALASHIPVPMLGTVVSQGLAFASKKAQAELQTRSVAEADKQLANKTGSAAQAFFTSDAQAGAAVTKSIDQYKEICKFIQALPTNITSFDDAVTFPAATFRVQAAASAVNVALQDILQYLAAMQERMTQVQTVAASYRDTVRRGMPAAVDAVLQKGYSDAYQSGVLDIGKNKYAAPAQPNFTRPTQTGGATQLAAYLAHAVASGYYDAGNRGPVLTRPRSGAAVPPPLPFKR